jgi:hypothetical protein
MLFSLLLSKCAYVIIMSLFLPSIIVARPVPNPSYLADDFKDDPSSQQ